MFSTHLIFLVEMEFTDTSYISTKDLDTDSRKAVAKVGLPNTQV